MIDMSKPMGLYIHVPFCNKKCDYCDFVSYSMDKKAQQLYMEALFAEIDMVKDQYRDVTFDTIFIGGGTPSIMFEGFVSGLARKLYSSFAFSDNLEFSIEVNPASFTKEKYFEYVQAGVNRISVGVQCLDDELLANHGRMQKISDVENTFNILNDTRFPNVNGDIMIGLPGQNPHSVIKTVKFLIEHHVKHISTYSLQIEKHTKLFDNLRQKKFEQTPEEDVVELYNKVYQMLKKAGFNRYEVSNFARAGFECRHNKKYWDGSNYLGLGVSAHSFVGGYRYFNTKRLDTYIDNLNQGKSPVFAKEYISLDERRTEFIMLSLRTASGIDLKRHFELFNENLLESKKLAINEYIKRGLLEVVDNHLRITEGNFYVSNALIVELL